MANGYFDVESREVKCLEAKALNQRGHMTDPSINPYSSGGPLFVPMERL